MDFLKVQFDRLRESLAGLSPSQKMLSGALVVIIAMTMVWFGKYAGSPEMVPLLDQPLSQDEIGRIQSNLKMNGVEFTAAGDGKLLVPADKQYAAVANLAFLNLLPRNTTSGFDDMIKQLTAWDGQDRQNAVFNHGKEMTLERVISNFPGVSTANVLIDPQSKRQLGKGDIEPTATVTVMLKEGVASTKQMATACANLVAGAQAGLNLGRIKVLLNGKLFPIRDANEDPTSGMEAANVLEIQAATEKMITEKLLGQYGYIDGIRVMVTVKVNNSSQSIEQIQHPKEDSFIADQKVTSRSNEQSTTSPGGGDSGVVANTGGTVTAGGGASAGPLHTSNESQESTDSRIEVGKTTKVTKTPAGEPTPVGVSVRLPRSYFVLAAKRGDPSAKEPDDATLDKIMAEEIAKVRKDVMVCTAIKSPDGISVESYTDLVNHNQPAVAVAGLTMALGGHVKDIALGGLALASLFMMSMIVRKGTPPAPAPIVAAAPAGPTGPNRLDASEAVAGEVTAGSPSLDAVELDDDTIRTQQMLTQVTSMVGDNPEAAATLIKRWMNQR